MHNLQKGNTGYKREHEAAKTGHDVADVETIFHVRKEAGKSKCTESKYIITDNLYRCIEIWLKDETQHTIGDTRYETIDRSEEKPGSVAKSIEQGVIDPPFGSSKSVSAPVAVASAIETAQYTRRFTFVDITH